MPAKGKRFKFSRKGKQRSDSNVKDKPSKNDEIAGLVQRALAEAPARGSAPVSKEKIPFTSFPISTLTLKGLAEHKFKYATEIQQASVPHALCKRDLLGAAKTGSGKTLAFVVPVLERLYTERWSREDGLGALILSPTRELALQIFEVLRNVGKFHGFSAGLVIGGKDYEEERLRVGRMNILVGTPGRVLQHFETAVDLDCSSLQILVLDEADRCLDMGFKKQIDAILDYLPKAGRQTLLFSATQPKSVKDLARLSLRQPEYVAVHEQAAYATPGKLVQFHISVPLVNKYDTLFAFVKSHVKNKMIVFMSTCKQVKYAYEVFCRLRPGIPVLQLTSKMKQMKRMSIFVDFSQKTNGLLFATDIASRGLDIPKVDWVIQFDCPEDVDTYIHRVGRTARFEAGGRSLLFLTPDESGPMISLLKDRKIPVKSLSMNPEKRVTLKRKMAACVSSSAELKYLAQKAFISFLRFTFVQPNKELFNVDRIPLDTYAQSLGLVNAPKLNFGKIEKNSSFKDKNFNTALVKVSSEASEKKENESSGRMSKADRILSSKGAGTLDDRFRNVADGPGLEAAGSASDDSNDNDLLTFKRIDHDIDISGDLGPKSKKAMRKIRVNADVSEKKVLFDEDGNQLPAMAALGNVVPEQNPEVESEEISRFQQQVRDKLKERDVQDKRVAKEKRLEKRRETRRKHRDDDDDSGDEAGVQLAVPGEDVSDEYSDSGSSSAEEHVDSGRPSKMRKTMTVADEEELALQLLS